MRANALASSPMAAERQMFTAFDRWVRTGGVTQNVFRPEVKEQDTPAYSTVDCRSDVSGTPASVRNFLRAMSRDPLANKVDSFELTTKDDNGQQLTLGLSLSGLILADSGSTPLPPPTNTAAVAQDTSAGADSGLFQIISRNNIFDQNRTPRSADDRPRIRVETISCVGVAFDNGVGSACFSGSGVSSTGLLGVGNSINRDFKIAKIDTNYMVTLTNSESNTFVLPDDRSVSLRRENGGDWHKAGFAADSAPETGATASESSTPASGAGDNDVIARLKRQREEAEK
jgi:hypothetical protein